MVQYACHFLTDSNRLQIALVAYTSKYRYSVVILPEFNESSLMNQTRRSLSFI
ncbi:hypothetical protein NTGHW29_280068 [Candidatus Nitrotoga sp. HW29]|nr:hypothetical protein NTGHW29_280068 [Candidatus Nitrotoga sp. HW29]